MSLKTQKKKLIEEANTNVPAKISNMGSFNKMRIPNFNQPSTTQAEAMNPSIKFKKLRSKLKY